MFKKTNWSPLPVHVATSSTQVLLPCCRFPIIIIVCIISIQPAMMLLVTPADAVCYLFSVIP